MDSTNSITSKSKKLHFFILLALTLSTLSILSLLPVRDYHYYSEAARSWRHGTSNLYDAQSSGLYYFPWSLTLLAPLSLLDDQWGQAALNLLTLISLIWAVRSITDDCSFKAMALSLTMPFSAAIIYLGQWDGLIVAGIALGWKGVKEKKSWLLGLALVIISTKPTNAFLPVLLLLWEARTWPLHDWIRITVPIGLAITVSFFMCGVDWPLRYLSHVHSSPPSGYDVSLWNSIGKSWIIVAYVIVLGWVIYALRNNTLNKEILSYSLVANLLISPFVVPYHYVSTTPALAILAENNWQIALVVWVLSVLLFVTFVSRLTAFHLALYPTILLAAFFLANRINKINK